MAGKQYDNQQGIAELLLQVASEEGGGFHNILGYGILVHAEAPGNLFVREPFQPAHPEHLLSFFRQQADAGQQHLVMLPVLGMLVGAKGIFFLLLLGHESGSRQLFADGRYDGVAGDDKEPVVEMVETGQLRPRIPYFQEDVLRQLFGLFGRPQPGKGLCVDGLPARADKSGKSLFISPGYRLQQGRVAMYFLRMQAAKIKK